MLVAHGLVLGRAGLKLRSVQADMPQTRQLQFHRQMHCLLESAVEKFSIVLAKITQYSKVRTMFLGNEHKRQVFIAAPIFQMTHALKAIET